jgi:ELWxxDGT repeat protein
VQDIRSGGNSSSPYGFTALGDFLYFSAIDGTYGYELWRTNGTTTELVEDINTGSSGADSSDPYGFTALGDFLYFQASDDTNTGLWRTDGTTTESVPFPGGTNQYISCDCYNTNIVAVGGRLYTTMYSSATGYEFAYLDEPSYVLPETSRDGSVWTTTLVILAGLTAAASIGLRLRGARRA